jgi:REP element-mobilizing transposase RayT
MLKKDYIEFQQSDSPIAYLLTFRCYGTWLHGDERGSVDRNHRAYGTPALRPSALRRDHDRQLMKQLPVRLNSTMRAAVEEGIRDTCAKRQWSLWTVNVRTNHVHAVTSASARPGNMLSALKANATRLMRDAGCWKSDRSPWAHRGSKKYLWNEKQLADAIAYVRYEQGEPLK